MLRRWLIMLCLLSLSACSSDTGPLEARLIETGANLPPLSVPATAQAYTGGDPKVDSLAMLGNMFKDPDETNAELIQQHIFLTNESAAKIEQLYRLAYPSGDFSGTNSTIGTQGLAMLFIRIQHEGTAYTIQVTQIDLAEYDRDDAILIVSLLKDAM